ncbi:MAG: metallophosphoesterase [Hungatella sp.]
MKILIVSDTHRKDDNLRTVIEKTSPIDVMIHLGDAEGSEDDIEQWLHQINENCLLYMVLGNNDFFSSLDREKEIRLGKYRVLITHGHYYRVSMGPEILAEEAKNRGCDIVMYGHTHRPFLSTIQGVTVLNPGSLSYPRQDGRKPSYMIMEIDAHGDVHYTQNYLE